MKNWIKTAIATGAIALNVVVAEAASAVSFTFNQTLTNSYSIQGGVDGTLAADNNTVEDPVLKWWKVLDETGTTVYNVEDVATTQYNEYVYSFTLDGSDVHISFDAYNDQDNLYTEQYVYIDGRLQDLPNTTSYRRVSVNLKPYTGGLSIANILADYIPSGIVDKYSYSYRGNVDWQVTMENEPASVPEPSLIIGSLLTVAIGTKTLKRGNQK